MTGWLLAVWGAGVVHAGGGPWVVGDGGITVYGGVEAQRIGHLATQSGDQRDVIEVGEGISTLGVKVIGTVGVGSRAEVELEVPWYRVEAVREDADICAIGIDACERTQGVGIVRTRLKGLLLDEFFGAPLSLAVGAEVRFGQLTAGTRERITNLGEGTLDTGAFVDVGRTGGLGRGYWSGWWEIGGRYRIPTTRSFPQMTGERSVPGSEFTTAFELILGPRTAFGIGPSGNALWRPFGVDFGHTDLTDPDRFGALKIATVRVGGTAVVRGRGIAASGSVQRVVFAYDNPTDTLFVSLGVQFDGRLPGTGDG